MTDREIQMKRRADRFLEKVNREAREQNVYQRMSDTIRRNWRRRTFHTSGSS